jgi:hypothetical protein
MQYFFSKRQRYLFKSRGKITFFSKFSEKLTQLDSIFVLQIFTGMTDFPTNRKKSWSN